MFCLIIKCFSKENENIECLSLRVGMMFEKKHFFFEKKILSIRLQKRPSKRTKLFEITRFTKYRSSYLFDSFTVQRKRNH